MRLYKVNFVTIVFLAIFFIFIIFLIIFGILDNGTSVFIKIFGGLLIPFIIYGVYLISTQGILVDDSKIEKLALPIKSLLCRRKYKTEGVLFWNEIDNLRARYILYPESPIIILEPQKEVGKKRMEILIGGIGGMDLYLLRDILAHIPSGTKISLYPHLEKMLEQKPDSKNKVMIIAGVLIFTIVAGFLLTLFKFDSAAVILSIIVLIGILIVTTLWRKK
ncbi:MAG: hypothetical protein Q8O30_06230 [Candidatus Omnitrophota bacterium]|nr:hypothetical protein [Candidatus Omnitrophota bacterium]